MAVLTVIFLIFGATHIVSLYFTSPEVLGEFKKITFKVHLVLNLVETKISLWVLKCKTSHIFSLKNCPQATWVNISGRWIAGFMTGLAGRTALLSVMVGRRIGQGEYSNKVMKTLSCYSRFDRSGKLK